MQSWRARLCQILFLFQIFRIDSIIATLNGPIANDARVSEMVLLGPDRLARALEVEDCPGRLIRLKIRKFLLIQSGSRNVNREVHGSDLCSMCNFVFIRLIDPHGYCKRFLSLMIENI